MAGDLFWEYISTLLWALVSNRSRYQGELEHSGRLTRLLIVEDRHALSLLLRPNTGAAILKIYQQQKVC